MTKAHEALNDLEQENHSHGTGERGELFTTVREALLTEDEINQLLAWFTPDYATDKDDALSDKLWKLLGVTG